MGVLSLANTIGSAIGAYFGGYIFDTTGSYDLAFVVAAVGLIIGVVLILAVRRPQESIHPLVQGGFN